MTNKRRLLLKAMLALAAGGSSILSVTKAVASWPKAAFEANKQASVLQSLYGDLPLTASEAINIKVAKIAENGLSVPVSVESDLPEIESISLVVPNNPFPLAAHFEHRKNTLGYASVRIKMAKSSDVIAVVKSQGKLYSASRPVKVTLGGCGG